MHVCADTHIGWCSVNCLHKRVRRNWTTPHCRCIHDDIGMKLFSRRRTSLDGRSGSGITSITSWTIERALYKKCNQIPMAVAQRLISSMMRPCVGACGVLQRSYPILCSLTRCTVLCKSDIPMKIRHNYC